MSLLCGRISCYTGGMNNVEMIPQAQRHGVTKTDAMYAMFYAKKRVNIPGRDGHADATLFIGHPHGQTERYLEVIAEIKASRRIVIFHAMELSDKFRHYLYQED